MSVCNSSPQNLSNKYFSVLYDKREAMYLESDRWQDSLSLQLYYKEILFLTLIPEKIQ